MLYCYSFQPILLIRRLGGRRKGIKLVFVPSSLKKKLKSRGSNALREFVWFQKNPCQTSPIPGNIYTMGCLTTLQGLITDNTNVLAGAGIGVSSLMVNFVVWCTKFFAKCWIACKQFCDIVFFDYEKWMFVHTPKKRPLTYKHHCRCTIAVYVWFTTLKYVSKAEHKQIWFSLQPIFSFIIWFSSKKSVKLVKHSRRAAWMLLWVLHGTTQASLAQQE